MDEKTIQDIDIVGNVINEVCGYVERNALRRVVNCISELEAELEHYKDAFKVVEAEMLERVPFEVFCRFVKAAMGKPMDCINCKRSTKQTCPLVG
jgi:hypothetical protein